MKPLSNQFLRSDQSPQHLRPTHEHQSEWIEKSRKSDLTSDCLAFNNKITQIFLTTKIVPKLDTNCSVHDIVKLPVNICMNTNIRFGRTTKFKHFKGTTMAKSEMFENLKNLSKSSASECDLIKANIDRVAIPLAG